MILLSVIAFTYKDTANREKVQKKIAYAKISFSIAIKD